MKKPDVSSVTMRTANINMTNTMANQITNLTKNKYTRSLFNSEGVSKSSFSNSFNIDVRLSSSIKSNNSYGANPVIAIDIISPDSQEFLSFIYDYNITNRSSNFYVLYNTFSRFIPFFRKILPPNNQSRSISTNIFL